MKNLNISRVDRHHLLFDRQYYNATDALRTLRNDCGLIARIDRDSHDGIHDLISSVPTPNRYMARAALHRLMPIQDKSNPLDMADQYMFAIQESSEHPKANDLDKMLGQLIIASVYHQKPFIEEGLSKARIFDLGGLGFRQIHRKSN